MKEEKIKINWCDNPSCKLHIIEIDSKEEHKHKSQIRVHNEDTGDKIKLTEYNTNFYCENCYKDKGFATTTGRFTPSENDILESGTDTAAKATSTKAKKNV